MVTTKITKTCDVWRTRFRNGGLRPGLQGKDFVGGYNFNRAVVVCDNDYDSKQQVAPTPMKWLSMCILHCFKEEVITTAEKILKQSRKKFPHNNNNNILYKNKQWKQ